MRIVPKSQVSGQPRLVPVPEAEEAVKAYHDESPKQKIPPQRAVDDDLKLGDTVLSYGENRWQL